MSFLGETYVTWKLTQVRGSGYVEAEARFFKKLGSDYVLKAYIYIYTYILIYI